MGDRVSIQFIKQGKKPSTVLYSAWGGMGFVRYAEGYARDLMAERKGKSLCPLDRLEPSIVMIDFIRHLTAKMDRVDSGLYLHATEDDDDNGDNGHHKILLFKEES